MESDPTINTPTNPLPESASSNSVSNQCVVPPPVVAAPPQPASVVTIPVPVVNNEGTYAYVTVKGSLHDRSCQVFGLNDTELQALSKRFENGIKPVVNGVMIACPPMIMMNTLAQLSYKVVCSSGEAEICWTMQREI
ncbi:uncharacterized protein LOC133338784 [Musca vetustissima]|uniref:uncharacterized protein LOC133338784 n=1 Tax=Musca vetustissima TaxID=27455 RepID=UPI002AB5DF6B|nr:uncharacterized protein LOC133338784 [Musca vetustissima]